MSINISGFGLTIDLIASVTFPTGVVLTQFGDDADALDFPTIQLGESAMSLNGDLVKWSKPAVIPLTLNIIPNSLNDELLTILVQSNQVGKNKLNIQDNISMVIFYPDGAITTLTQGLITNAMVSSGVASAGRLKTKPYTFQFEGVVYA